VLLDMPRVSEKAERHRVPQVIFEGERKSMVGVARKADELARLWKRGSHRPEGPRGVETPDGSSANQIAL
jgi:hypothetical protein